GKTITLAAGENLSARNTTVLSENGQITVAAKGDVTLENGYNESRDDYGLKYKERGLLSSKTTTIKSRDESKTVTASTLSGDAVQITAGGNTNVTGSNVVGTHNVAISSGKDTSISSAEEYERHDYAKQVKKSGLLSGGGLGFTIGTEKRKDQYSDADLLQKASTVGSTSGNVSIESGNKVEIGASAVLAGKDISITGENVQISSKDNVYHSVEKHEYKKSGLTVSVGGAGIEAIESVAAPATRMTEVSDHRLKALYGYETAEKIKKNGDALKAAAKGNFSPTVSIGISSSSSKSESHSTMTEAQGSSLQAGQDMTIKTKEDLNVKGSDIVGNHIHLEADNDIHIWATEEKETQKSSQSSKGGSLGVSLSAGSVVSVDGKFYAGKGKENGSTTSYRASTVNANDTLTMKSGKDTDLIGSTVSGNKVKADVYGNLNIESLQTKKEYSEENISAGMSFSTAAGKTSYGGSASKGNMKSHYESVINQAGIRAGGEGFDISVKENTDLKGGVIDSAASKDKNTLTTGTLRWEDKENKADYKAGGMGVSYLPNNKSSKLNQRGLTPNLTPTVKDNADSTTKSAVAEGTIHITNKEKQKQDIASLNRDTKNSLNQLQEIFDKTKVEEKQELVGMLKKYGNQAIHTYAESKGWKDGSTEKMLLHGAFGALMGDMAGGSAATGALSGGVNEYVMGYLTKTKGKEWVQKHPDTVQWLSAGVGAAIGNLSKDVLTGAGVSLGASKWNYLGFELPETEHLLEETLIRKDGQELADDESRKVFELIYQTANQGDPYGAASDSELKVGNTIAIAGVTAVLQKHYTKESVDSFLKKYHEMVNSKITDGKVNNEITLRPVHVIANRNQNNFDIFLIQYSAGPVEQGYLYDKRSDKFFVTNGFTESNDLHMGLHLGGEVAGITLKTNSSSIDLNDKKTRSEILSGGSVGGTVYAGLGGGVSTPVSGEYLGKVLVFKYGVGTPQVGIGYDVAEETPEESVPISIRYLLRGK
ncbi:MAG: hemagglutinin repeat-containing protein, partial [Dialister sp.]|nr:hemagglutinin repeat-containing protein [Dialister sp.]